nr:transposon-encoded TnpW family protein [uncultured Oscillibacter sp.]
MTFPRPKPDTPPSMVKKIGKTTYLVWAHFSETSTETMEDKIKRMLREEVRQMMADE